MANQKQWTRNYDNLFSAVFGTSDGSSGSTETPTHARPWFRDINGTYRGFMLTYGMKAIAGVRLTIHNIVSYGCTANDATLTYWSATSSSDNGCKIQLGTGEGSVSKEDYKLISPITSNMTLGTVSRSWVYNEEEHSYTVTFKIPVSYSGATPIDITEFGIFGVVPYSWGNAPLGKDTMLYHEIFESPVTLEQNDVIEIQLSQTVIQPNYTEYPSTDTE